MIKRWLMRLCLVVMLVAMTLGSFSLGQMAVAQAAETVVPTYGAPTYVDGSPVGGGAGYLNIIAPSQADYVVDTAAELKSALAGATSGEIVYVADGATITFTDTNKSAWYSSSYMCYVKAGVTLAGGRGRAGVTGGIIRYKEATPVYSGGFQKLIYCSKDAKVCGLTLVGPSDNKLVINAKGAIAASGGAEVYNNEMHGWGYGGVTCVRGDGRQIWVHHNYIHHNQYLTHVGYGIQPNPGAVVLAEGNRIEYDRHHLMISGGTSGGVGASVEFRYNLLGYSDYTQLDSHGDNDDPDNPAVRPAGNVVKIHHNTSTYAGQSFYQCRGIPATMVSVYNNWWYGSSGITDGPVHQHMYDMTRANGYPVQYGYTAPDGGAYVHMESYDNWYGTTSPPSTITTNQLPVPTLLSPSNGAVTTDHTPFLDWSTVTDASPVHYQLQVDDNADFSSTVVNKTSVTTSSYTVTTTLYHTTYYWRVRVVDAEGNTSAWTVKRSFRIA